MNRAQALSKLNRSDMRNAAAERGMQRLFTWNRAHWIGMVVLIAVLLLLQWSSSMYLMPDEVLDRAAKNLFVWFPGMVLHWPLVLGITNLILGSTRSGSLSFPLASAIIGHWHSAGPIFAYGRGSHTVPGLRESRNIMKTAISCNDARADPSKGANHERATDGTVPVARTTQMP